MRRAIILLTANAVAAFLFACLGVGAGVAAGTFALALGCESGVVLVYSVMLGQVVFWGGLTSIWMAFAWHLLQDRRGRRVEW